jgi:DNA-binding SARP family transcriptional activator
MELVAKGSVKASEGVVRAAEIAFGVLGPLEARSGDDPLPLGGTKPRALLALLLLNANEVVSSDRLVDELWGAEPPSTAVTALHVHVSQLRKALKADRELLLTRGPGYVLTLERGQLDLSRFELLAAEGERALADGDPSSAARSFGVALDLWRGPALGDLVDEPFAHVPILRLEELRLRVIEARGDAELALGHHAALVPELETLVVEHPLRERFWAQLMTALYRSGRQADALEVYRRVRSRLVDELGIEPSPTLQRLERAILRQDATLELAAAPDRTVLVVPATEQGTDGLLAVAEPLARRGGRRLVVARIVREEGSLSEASRQLHERLGRIGERVSSQAAAFVSDTPAEDIVRLSARLDAELVLLETSRATLAEGSLEATAAGVLAEAPCDVALLTPRRLRAGAVVVPFGGGEHDWAAIEVGAWIAHAHERPLRLAGVRARRGRRDASRALADASLAVQYALGVEAEPVLLDAGPQGLSRAAEQASLLVVGLSDRWRRDGLGETRATLARDCDAPVLFVRRGVRPSGLAPPETGTRYTWSVAVPTTP